MSDFNSLVNLVSKSRILFALVFGIISTLFGAGYYAKSTLDNIQNSINRVGIEVSLKIAQVKSEEDTYNAVANNRLQTLETSQSNMNRRLDIIEERSNNQINSLSLKIDNLSLLLIRRH